MFTSHKATNFHMGERNAVLKTVYVVVQFMSICFWAW